METPATLGDDEFAENAASKFGYVDEDDAPLVAAAAADDADSDGDGKIRDPPVGDPATVDLIRQVISRSGHRDQLSLKSIFKKLHKEHGVKVSKKQQKLWQPDVLKIMDEIGTQPESADAEESDGESHKRKKSKKRKNNSDSEADDDADGKKKKKKDKKRDKKKKRKHEREEHSNDDGEQQQSHSEAEPEQDDADHSDREQSDDDEAKNEYPGMPKRPMTAFFMFSAEVREELKREQPDLKFTEQAKEAGTRWRALSAVDKHAYTARAQADLEQYKRELEDYFAEHPEVKAKLEREKKKRKRKGADSEAAGAPMLRERRAGARMDAESDGESEARQVKKDPNAPLTAVDRAIIALKAGKRRKKDDLEEQDRLDMVKLFIDKCLEAAKKDQQSNKLKQPALEKLKILELVTSTLQQVDWHEIYLDENVLKVFSAFLRPLPDGSMPNMKLRNTMLQLLNQLPVTQDHLEDSDGLGHILVHLASQPTETEENRKLIMSMIQRWSRPILDIQTDYARLEEVEREKMHEIKMRKQALARMEQVKEEKLEYSLNKARLPTRAMYDYAIRPESEVNLPKASKQGLSHSQQLLRRLDTNAKERGSGQAKTVHITRTV